MSQSASLSPNAGVPPSSRGIGPSACVPWLVVGYVVLAATLVIGVTRAPARTGDESSDGSSRAEPSPREAREVAGRRSEPAQNLGGVGHHLVNGVFESAISKLRIRLPPGWRLSTAGDAQRLSPSAEAVFSSRRLEAYVTVSSQPRRAQGSSVPTMLSVESGLARSGTWSANVAGASLAFDRYVDPGTGTETLVGTLESHDRLIVLGAGYPLATREPALRELTAFLGEITALSPARVASLEKALAASAEPQNMTTADASLRGSVYRHFGCGVKWLLPAGFVRFFPPDVARRAYPGGALAFDDAERGLFGVIAFSAPDVSSPLGRHQDAVAYLDASLGLLPGETKPRRLGDATAYDVEARGTGDSALASRLVTTSTSRCGVQMVIWGARDDMREARAFIEEAVQGLTIDEQPATTRTSSTRPHR